MDNIIALLNDFRDFQKTGDSDDFEGFGDFLKSKYTNDKASFQTKEPTVNAAGTDAMVSYLLGGLIGYVEAWVKITYKDLPIGSLGDFGILKSVQVLQNPTKKDVVDRLVMERSTCIEAIKRLIKKGLIQEETDEEDHRMKRVKLTDYGQEIVATLDQKMTALSTLLVGILSEAEKQQIMPMLMKLNKFHNNLYRNKEGEEIKEIFGL